MARASGLSAHTLRYYEDIGLIDPVRRSASGHRCYSEHDQRWIAFLLRLRATGMSIQDMLAYAMLRRDGQQLDSVVRRQQMLQQHVLTLENRLAALQDNLSVMRDKVVFYTELASALQAEAQPNSTGAAMTQSHFQQGWNRLREVDAEAGERVIASLQDISPDLGRYIIEFGFGEVYCRPGLSLQQRELATIAALTALGNATPQLKVHIAAGLNVGLSQQEIHETILQMAVYAGFPARSTACLRQRGVCRT
jgi:DNA-binding transcriptional MerR regulator